MFWNQLIHVCCHFLTEPHAPRLGRMVLLGLISCNPCNFCCFTYERWWHVTGSGPQTSSSRACFCSYGDTRSEVTELAQSTGKLDPSITILCTQNAEFWKVNMVVHIVTTVLQRIKHSSSCFTVQYQLHISGVAIQIVHCMLL